MEGSDLMKHENKSSPAPDDQSSSIDPILRWMMENGVSLTRESYLNVAYMGNPPKELGPEEEAELPEQFQRWGDQK